MGEAYLTAFDLERAGQLFRRTLEMNRGYTAEADRRWKTVQKIQRALPGTANGQKIALVERLTRADAAALFMEELKLDLLYQKRRPAPSLGPSRILRRPGRRPRRRPCPPTSPHTPSGRTSQPC
jgi:hypothetical protein